MTGPTVINWIVEYFPSLNKDQFVWYSSSEEKIAEADEGKRECSHGWHDIRNQIDTFLLQPTTDKHKGGVTSPGTFAVLIRHTGDTDGVLVDRNERSGSMEQVEGVFELNVFRAVFLAYVECRTDLLHPFLGTKRRQTLELGVVEGQTDSGIWVGLGLSMEDGGIQYDVSDIVQDVLLDLDEVRFSKDDDLDRLYWLARGVFEVLDLGNDPNQINVRHRLAHQTRHDTETSNLDLELPIDDLVFQGSDQNLPSLALFFWPPDDLLRLSTRETELLYEGPIVVVIFPNWLVSLRNDIEPVVLDAVVRLHEDVGGKEGSDKGNKEEETVEDGTDGEVTSWLKRPAHRSVVHNQSLREVGFWRGGHIDKVNGQRVRGESVKDAIAIGITVEAVVEMIDAELNGGGPPIHDLKLPLSVAVLCQRRRNVGVETEPIELSSSEETWNSAGGCCTHSRHAQWWRQNLRQLPNLEAVYWSIERSSGN